MKSDMGTATSRVTRQHQLSVPAVIRKRYGIRPGTVLVWEEHDGRLAVRAKRRSLEEIQKILAQRSVATLTLQQIDAAKKRVLSRKLSRGRR